MIHTLVFISLCAQRFQIFSVYKGSFQAGEMVQRVEVLATKPDTNRIKSLGPTGGGREPHLLQVVLWPPHMHPATPLNNEVLHDFLFRQGQGWKVFVLENKPLKVRSGVTPGECRCSLGVAAGLLGGRSLLLDWPSSITIASNTEERLVTETPGVSLPWPGFVP